MFSAKDFLNSILSKLMGLSGSSRLHVSERIRPNSRAVTDLLKRAEAALVEEVSTLDGRLNTLMADIADTPQEYQAELSYNIGKLCFDAAHASYRSNAVNRSPESTKYLAWAVNFFKVSLNLTSETTQELAWAMVISELGHAISMMGAISPEPLKFDEHAGKCFEAAMQVFDTPKFQGTWLLAAKGLWSLHMFAAKGASLTADKQRHLRIAEKVIKEAARKFEIDCSDMLGATVLRDLGHIQVQMGAVEGEVAKLEAGIRFLIRARREMTAPGHVESRLLALEWLDSGVEALCKTSPQSEMLEQVRNFYQELTANPNKLETIDEYGRTQLQFGKCLEHLSGLYRDPKTIEAARRAYLEAMSALEGDNLNYFWRQARLRECLCGIRVLFAAEFLQSSTIEDSISKLDEIIREIEDAQDGVALVKGPASLLRSALVDILASNASEATTASMKPN